MAQIFLKTSLKTEEQKIPILYEGIGLLEEDKITYQEEKIMTVIKKIGNQLLLIRRCKEYEISIPFNLEEITYGTYQLHEVNQQLDFKVITNKLVWKNRRLDLSYQLELGETVIGKYEYQIIYEVRK